MDKKIANEVEVVQTLSRLNRIYAGKDQIYIIDFVNDPQWILSCFKKYDNGAEILEVQDPNVVYSIKDSLDEAHLYTKDDLEQFKIAYFKTIREFENNTFSQNKHAELYKATDEVVRRYNDKLEMLKSEIAFQEEAFDKSINEGNQAGADKAEFERKKLSAELMAHTDFKNNLGKFGRIYNYVAQLIDFGDPELENFAAFSKLVAKRLHGLSVKEIDISGLVLTGYGIFKKKMEGVSPDIDVDSVPPLTPISPITTNEKAPIKLSYLKEIIDLISAVFGDISTTEEQVVLINHLAAIIRKDDVVMAQIRSNSEDVAMKGNLPSAVMKAVIQALGSHQALSAVLLNKDDDQALNNIIKVLYRLLKNGDDIDLKTL